jgi:uncharacterized glyoxalase superfamily protein PhnB
MSVELAFGESVVHVGSEFPDMGIVSPLAIGGTATTLQINTDDADALWTPALSAGANTRHELADAFWGERPLVPVAQTSSGFESPPHSLGWAHSRP